MTITSSREEAKSVLSMLGEDGWPTAWVSSCRDALLYLNRHAPCLVLCESKLPDGSWKTIMDTLDVMESAPLLIVFPSPADRTLVPEALNVASEREGYQVQLKSFDLAEVETVIRTAILDAEVPVTGA